MMGRRIPCKYHWKCVLPPVLMAFRGHFQSSDVHKTLRRLKNPLHAAAENVNFVRGPEPPCYLVFVFFRLQFSGFGFWDVTCSMGFLVALGKNLFDALLGFLDLPADNLTWQRKIRMFIVKMNFSMEFHEPMGMGGSSSTYNLFNVQTRVHVFFGYIQLQDKRECFPKLGCFSPLLSFYK